MDCRIIIKIDLCKLTEDNCVLIVYIFEYLKNKTKVTFKTNNF